MRARNPMKPLKDLRATLHVKSNVLLRAIMALEPTGRDASQPIHETH